MSEVTLREVTGDWQDAYLIVTWRNAAAEYFPPQKPWTVAGQVHWYRDVYRHDPSLNLYFVCVDGKPIGTVGMRIRNGKGEMMWMVRGNTEMARKGYMRQGMRLLMEAYGLKQYWGRVMPANKAGLEFQVKNGFHVIGMMNDMLIISRNFDGTYPLEP